MMLVWSTHHQMYDDERFSAYDTDQQKKTHTQQHKYIYMQTNEQTNIQIEIGEKLWQKQYAYILTFEWN